MPALSAWTVRVALAWLAVAALLGALLLARGALGHPEWARLIPVHAEAMLIGWMVQLTFGVAHWILPRTAARVSTVLPVIAVGALNVGVLVVILGVPRWGRLFEAGAVVLFAVQAVPRIRAAGWGATGRGGDLVRLGRKVEQT